jgi:hypothetical protein
LTVRYVDRRAIDVLGKIETSHPSIPAVALWMADCNEAIRLDPGSAAAYRARAEIFRMNGDPEGALADTNEGIRLDPQYALN